MKPTLLLLVFSAGLFAETFTGVITDTMCGKSHNMMAGQPDDKCIAACVKGPSQYALYDGKTVLKLSDQKTPAKFTAKRMRITGTLDEKTHTIKVTSMVLSEPRL